MPHAIKMDFVPYIGCLSPTMRKGINDDLGKDEDAGLKSSTLLFARSGDLCPDLLFPAFENVYAAKVRRLEEPCDFIQRRECLMEAEKGCHCVLCGVRYNPPPPSS
jgi:hypothetical protein